MSSFSLLSPMRLDEVTVPRFADCRYTSIVFMRLLKCDYRLPESGAAILWCNSAVDIDLVLFKYEKKKLVILLFVVLNKPISIHVDPFSAYAERHNKAMFDSLFVVIWKMFTGVLCTKLRIKVQLQFLVSN